MQKHQCCGKDRSRTASRDVGTVLSLGIALMALSLGSALVEQPAVAVLAGTGAVGVTRELARRLLSPGARR